MSLEWQYFKPNNKGQTIVEFKPITVTKMATKKIKVKWLPEPEEQDYPAALSYLLLIYDKATATKKITRLKTGKIINFKAKDIFRASGLSLLGVSNSHVEKDKNKISNGDALSPLLLVRDSAHGKVIVADGYHRLCAVYIFDEDALIPCKIV